MITNRRFKHFITLFLSPFLISGLLLHPAIITFSHAASTITSDGTMWTTINQAGNIYNINGGTIKGTNQFHSFGLFSVGTGDTASFNGPSWIANIIGRITGGQPSIIDGTLRSKITGANLYLLNPYGVLFGPNATLDVSGSFHVSTADYLRMADGARFYADLGKQSTLSTAPVAAFGFLSNNPAAIFIQESNLQVPEGKTLSVVGGDIAITGSPTGGYVAAPSGRINIASVASPGEVIPVESRDAPDLQMSSFDRLGRIYILNGVQLDVGSSYGSSSGGGTVVIRGGKLLVDYSMISADTGGNIDGAKVGIDIGISGSMEMKNNSKIESSTYGAGNSGNIEVHTGSLDMREGSQINICNYSSGNAGNVTVTADSIFLTGAYDSSGGTHLYSSTGFGSAGRGGDIRITTGTLEVRDGASILTDTWGSGVGGNVDINAKSILVSSGENAMGFTVNANITAQTWGSGNAGNIGINTGNLEARNGDIGTYSFSSGKAGDLEVTADRILLGGDSGLTASAANIGDGGNIRIKAGSLEMTDGALITSNTSASGAGGNIEVTVNSVLLSGNGLFVSPRIMSDATGPDSTGPAGNIRINAQTLEVRDYAQISSGTHGAGKGGNIEVNADSVLVKDGGGISADSVGSGSSGSIDVTAGNVVISGVAGSFAANISAITSSDILGEGGSGKGGVIQIKTNNLEVKDGAYISVTSWGQGDAGSIIVTAKDILLDGGSHLSANMSANARGSGNAGDINITTNTLEMRGGAQIQAVTDAEGQGGSIRINAADQVILSGVAGVNYNTGVLSTAYSSGSAGDIQVTAGNLQVNDGAYISSATKGSGKAGNISLTAPWITMTNGGYIQAGTYGGSGTGGSIQVSGNQIQLINGASIAAESLGMANAGDIGINAGGTLLMKNSSIATEAFQADGGNIHIKAGHMVELIDSKITASVGGGTQTTGGNITIDPQYVILNDSQIVANAYKGKGGNIRIIADVFLASPESVVDASSALGINGTVDIRAPITNISGTLAPMQGDFLSTEMLLRDRCIARIRGEKYSSFVVRGRDGLPIRPGSVLPSPIY